MVIKNMLDLCVETDLLSAQGIKQSKLIQVIPGSSRKFSYRVQLPSDALIGWVMVHSSWLIENPNQTKSHFLKTSVQGNNSYCWK